MRRAVAGVWDVPAEGGGPALAAIGICFFLGSAAGCLLAAAAKGSGGESLTAYIQGFLSRSFAAVVGFAPLACFRCGSGLYSTRCSWYSDLVFRPGISVVLCSVLLCSNVRQ